VTPWPRRLRRMWRLWRQEYDRQDSRGKCDIDANPMVPTQLEIRSIPSLLMFRSGQVVGQVVGAVPRARILDLVNKAL